jgi:hypothetical protein
MELGSTQRPGDLLQTPRIITSHAARQARS